MTPSDLRTLVEELELMARKVDDMPLTSAGRMLTSNLLRRSAAALTSLLAPSQPEPSALETDVNHEVAAGIVDACPYTFGGTKDLTLLIEQAMRRARRSGRAQREAEIVTWLLDGSAETEWLTRDVEAGAYATASAVPETEWLAAAILRLRGANGGKKMTSPTKADEFRWYAAEDIAGVWITATVVSLPEGHEIGGKIAKEIAQRSLVRELARQASTAETHAKRLADAESKARALDSVLAAAREALVENRSAEGLALGKAIREYDRVRGALCKICDGVGTTDTAEDELDEWPTCATCDGTGLVEPR